MQFYSNFPQKGRGWWSFTLLPEFSIMKVDGEDEKIVVPDELKDYVPGKFAVITMGWLFWEVYWIIK